ncbi:hypothetical protein [Thermococcus sp.]
MLLGEIKRKALPLTDGLKLVADGPDGTVPTRVPERYWSNALRRNEGDGHREGLTGLKLASFGDFEDRKYVVGV